MLARAAVLKTVCDNIFKLARRLCSVWDTKPRVSSQICDTDWTETESEIDALFLELKW